jgi:acetolactate synthase-1/2/3 large subunit
MVRPVMLCGLGARSVAAEVRQVAESCGVPVLVTYKAKGVVPDEHPWFGGVLTNGALERPVLERADAFVTVGLDTVELLPRPWTYRQPMVEWPVELGRSEWDEAEITELVEAQRQAMRVSGEPGELLPNRVVEIAAEEYAGARITVDAGAHMFPVMALWPAREPCGVLISNGLSTMGFALPAAIGAALLDRSERVVVFTGDGGLLMCLAELRTAAREKLRLRIIVFEDGELSLIRMKQVQRGYRTEGVSIGDMDWRGVACSMGVEGRVAASEEELRACLRETAELDGPVLIAARIAARVYPEMMRALRGPQ